MSNASAVAAAAIAARVLVEVMGMRLLLFAGQRSNPNSDGALGGVDGEAGGRGDGGAGGGGEAVAGGADGGGERGEGGGAVGSEGCAGDWLGAREVTRRWT